MRIVTVGELAQNVRLASLIPEKASDMKPKSFTDDAGKTETKSAPDGSGRVQYRTSLKALRVDDDGTITGEERDVSLSILEPADIVPGVQYGLSGVTWITHYQTNAGRVGVSIVAERVKPIDQLNKVSIAELASKLSASSPSKAQG